MQNGHIITIVTVAKKFKRRASLLSCKRGEKEMQLVRQVVCMAFIKIYRVRFTQTLKDGALDHHRLRHQTQRDISSALCL